MPAKTSQPDAGQAQGHAGFTNRARGAGLAAAVQERQADVAKREARQAIGEFVSKALGEWKAAFEQRAVNPALPAMPTIAVLCEELNSAHPKMIGPFNDLEVRGNVIWRHEDYLKANQDFAAGFNALQTVTELVKDTLGEWEKAFRQRSDNARPPLVPTIIDALCEKIGSAHADLHQYLGAAFVRSHVASYAEKLYAFEAMEDIVKHTLDAWEAGFRQRRGHMVLPPTSVIVDALCDKMTQRYPYIDRQLGADSVREYVAAHAACQREQFKSKETGAGGKGLDAWTQEFRQRAVTESLQPALEAGSAGEQDDADFLVDLARPSHDAWEVMGSRSSLSSVSSMNSVAMMGDD